MCNALRMSLTPLPDLIGSKDACRILNVDRATLTRWVQSGRLETVGKLPGRNGALLFDKSAVEAVAAEDAEADS